MLIFILWKVFSKIFGGINAVAEPVNQIIVEPIIPSNEVVTTQTYELNLNGRNPFKVSTKATEKRPQKKIPQRNKKNPSSVIKQVRWPSVKYFGFVKSERSANKLVVLKVNGRLYRKRVSESIQDITISKAYNDSIIVVFEGETKTIKK